MAPLDATPQENIDIPAVEKISAALPDLQSLTVSDIDDSGRLRPIDSVAAQAIAASMAKDGLLQPIEVCRLPGQTGWKLVYGGHRLAAAKLLGWKTIACFVRSAEALGRKSREIAENLFKAELSPIDRAGFVAELYAVEKARAGVPIDGDGRAFSANVRWQKALKEQASDATLMISGAYGMQDSVAEKIGMSVQTVRNDLLLFKRLQPSLVERIRKLEIAGNAAALRKLAGEGFQVQEHAVTLMEQGKAAKVSDALAIISRKAVPDATAKRLSTFLDTFARMGLREQKDALRMLQARLPKSLAFTFNEDMAEETAVPVMDTPKPKNAKGVR
jgi:ParB family chromosome partitioning protein